MSAPTAQIFHVPPELAGQTITSALRHWLAGQSWSDVRGLLRARHIQINGNLCLDEGRRLKEAEVVKILPHSAAAPPSEDDVRIRYIDQHLVVVEKPAGMTTLRHPEERDWPRSRKQLQPTLDEILPRIVEKRERHGPSRGSAPGKKGSQGRKQSAPKGPTKRLRPVHRLDRETSGLMVFARTVDAERALGLQFRAHSLDRVYIAVAQGQVDEQTFESNLVDDRGDGRRGSTHNPKLGKHAVTHVKPMERIGKYTVVECRLETGRTHQIRIHLSEAGHPLCGDKVYRGKFPGPPMADDSGAPRVALHAAELGFDHPITGEHLRHVMPLPRELVELIDRLRETGKHRRARRASGAGEEPPAVDEGGAEPRPVKKPKKNNGPLGG
ncbi:MAG: RluA family pseudouridine synthase [Planctomycetota bacterium]|nr:RluA family pseudouridine synthase [Planctomycetota bacterium]